MKGKMCVQPLESNIGNITNAPLPVKQKFITIFALHLSLLVSCFNSQLHADVFQRVEEGGWQGRGGVGGGGGAVYSDNFSLR